ncbi:hypothetical protein RDABS01_036923 [Bienertia sinuspersici]
MARKPKSSSVARANNFSPTEMKTVTLKKWRREDIVLQRKSNLGLLSHTSMIQHPLPTHGSSLVSSPKRELYLVNAFISIITTLQVVNIEPSTKSSTNGRSWDL